MTTRVTNPFKRELEVDGAKYTLTVSQDGFKLVLKGRRKGVELAWRSIVNGEAALASALNASLLGGHSRSSAPHDLAGHYGTKH